MFIETICVFILSSLLIWAFWSSVYNIPQVVEQQDQPESTCEECDCELHKLVQERINKNFFPSLQALSASFILDHFELYSTDNEGTGPQSVKLLSDNARQSLLELLETQNLSKIKREPPQHYLKLVDKQYFQKIFATFQQLVGPKCKEFSLDWLLVFCPEPDKLFFGDKALNILALEAPFLESLVIGYESLWVTLDGQIQLQKWINSSFRLQLFTLHSLKSLKMPGHSLQPEDLILIGQKLPHLELLLCNLFSGDGSGQLRDATAKMIGTLANFKHFIFYKVEVSPYDRNLNYHRFCFMNFPQLHTIGFYDSDCEFLRSDFRPIKRQLTRLSFCDATDLQVLQSVLSNNLMPNVNHILISYYNGQTWDPMLFNLVTSFPNISEFTLHETGNERKFLLAYGPNLLKLTLRDIMFKELEIPLEELVELCPKLEELCLSGCHGPAPVIFPKPELHTLDSLTRLELDWCIPYPINSLLMIAPNIKRLIWSTVDPSCEDEIKRLIELIKSKMVCQKLVFLEITLSLEFLHEEPEELFPQISMTLGELVKVMCAYVPTLEEVYFGMSVRNFDSDVLIGEEYDFMLPFVNNFCLRKCVEAVDAVHGKYKLRHEWYRV